MELSQCPRCGTYVIAGRTNGYDVAVNTTPLDAQTLAAALIAGRQIYRPRFGERGNVVGLDWIRPGSEPLDPSMRGEHECGSTVVYKPVKAAVGGNPSPAPAEAVRPTGQLSRGHFCDHCGVLIPLDGHEEYVAVELGATVIWATHTDCGV